MNANMDIQQSRSTYGRSMLHWHDVCQRQQLFWLATPAIRLQVRQLLWLLVKLHRQRCSLPAAQAKIVNN